ETARRCSRRRTFTAAHFASAICRRFLSRNEPRLHSCSGAFRANYVARHGLADLVHARRDGPPPPLSSGSDQSRADSRTASPEALTRQTRLRFAFVIEEHERRTLFITGCNLGEGPAIGIGNNDGTALIFSHQQGVWLSGGVLHADNSA